MRPIIALYNLIKNNQKKDMTVAEIGVYDGITTKTYIDIIANNNGKIYAVDWFCGNENVDGIHAYNPNLADIVYDKFLTNIAPYKHIVDIKKGKSHEMIGLIPDRSLDLCFIDADHRYSSVYKDIELCLPKMKPNSIICGHDCENINLANTPESLLYREQDTANNAHYGVIQAVFDHFGKDIVSLFDPDGQNVPLWVKHL